MHNRGLLDTKGELFAYLEGDRLYSLDGELTGQLKGDYIVELGYRLTVVEATDRSLVKLRVEPNADAEVHDADDDHREPTSDAT